MREFCLTRTTDISGVSGTGTVAEGVEFSDGRVVLCWLVGGGAMGVYRTINEVIQIHGHNGATVVEWSAPDVGRLE